jgi:hypothetical protein
MGSAERAASLERIKGTGIEIYFTIHAVKGREALKCDYARVPDFG